MGIYDMPVCKLDPELRVRQRFKDLAFKLYNVIL